MVRGSAWPAKSCKSMISDPRSRAVVSAVTRSEWTVTLASSLRAWGALDRVAPGYCSPGAPTDPGVHVKCTRFVTLWNRCPSHDWDEGSRQGHFGAQSHSV